MENKMIEWINEQLRQREWSIRQLAQKANLSHTQISNVLSGKRNITRDFCVAIAKAFGERPEKVLRLASLLPPEPKPASGENDLLNVYRQLPASRRDFLLDAARGLQGISTSSGQIVIIDNDLSNAETDLLYIYRRIPAHMQETALDLLRVLIQVPAPAEVPADPPPSNDITEAIGNLDQQQQEQVLDFVEFMHEPRIQQVLHQKQRRRDIQRSIDIIDLYLAVCEATPEERERLITDLLYQLQGG